MEKRLIGVLIGIVGVLLIVYIDMLLWIDFGPNSIFQQFPVIYLALFPMIIILMSLLWGRLPGTA